MEWQDIREQCPDQWVLVEAVKAHTEDKKRILDSMSLLSTYSDSVLAWRSYTQYHHEFPQREFYVLHTSRPSIEITEVFWFGLRPELSSRRSANHA